MTREEALEMNAAAAALFNALTPGGSDLAELVETAYTNLLGLEGDFSNAETRKAFWVDQLETGAVARDDFAGEFLYQAENVPDGLSDDEQSYNQAAVPAISDASRSFVAQLAEEGRSVAELSPEEIVDAATSIRETASQAGKNAAPGTPPSDDGQTDQDAADDPALSDGISVELVTGDPVVSISESSTLMEDTSVVTITAAELDRFDDAYLALMDTSTQDFGFVLTFTAGDDVLQVGEIDFVGQSDLSELAAAVGYDGWLDFALFNGELVTPETLNLTDQEFFFGENDLEYYFGYDWAETAGGIEISREDGQAFTLDAVLYDTLGIANVEDVFAAIA